MGIVNWTDTKDKKAAEDIESSKDATMFLLKMDPQQLASRWIGKLKIQDVDFSEQPKLISVELRKSFGASVLIKIFDRKIRSRGDGNKLVHISMNSTVHMSEGDLEEMNLAIAEGIAVYRHPGAWIKLNKELGNTEVLF